MSPRHLLKALCMIYLCESGWLEQMLEGHDLLRASGKPFIGSLLSASPGDGIVWGYYGSRQAVPIICMQSSAHFLYRRARSATKGRLGNVLLWQRQREMALTGIFASAFWIKKVAPVTRISNSAVLEATRGEIQPIMAEKVRSSVRVHVHLFCVFLLF